MGGFIVTFSQHDKVVEKLVGYITAEGCNGRLK